MEILVVRPMRYALGTVRGLNPMLCALAGHSCRVRVCLMIITLATMFGAIDAASDKLQQAERSPCLQWSTQCTRFNIGVALVRNKRPPYSEWETFEPGDSTGRLSYDKVTCVSSTVFLLCFLRWWGSSTLFHASRTWREPSQATASGPACDGNGTCQQLPLKASNQDSGGSQSGSCASSGGPSDNPGRHPHGADGGGDEDRDNDGSASEAVAEACISQRVHVSESGSGQSLHRHRGSYVLDRHQGRSGTSRISLCTWSAGGSGRLSRIRWSLWWPTYIANQR